MRTDIACRRRLEKALGPDLSLVLSRWRDRAGISWVCGGCGREYRSPEDAGVRWLAVFGERCGGIGEYVCGDCHKRLSQRVV